MVANDAEIPTSRSVAHEMPQQSPSVLPRGGRISSQSLAKVHAILCLLGILVSAELTRIHLFVHTDPNYHSICAVSDGLNCETVAGSPYSALLGLPVSVWGLTAYLVMGLLSAWGIINRRLHATWPWGILSILAASCVVVSAILAYVAATQISSLCLFCVASYLVNVALLAVCVVVVRQSDATVATLLKKDIRGLLARPKLGIGLVTGGMAMVGGIEVGIPPYWATSAWSSLPKLDAGTDDQGRHWFGGCKPAITIVEFSDYECPHCRAAHKQMRELASKYKEQIRLVHRHLPLDMQCNSALKRPFHAHACRFSEAAECAALQGRFWEMNDALFSAQETVKAANVDPVDLAVRIGLNRLEFKHCLESHQTSSKVLADIRAALARGLEGTPSFLVGEQLYLGSIPESELLSRLHDRDTAQPTGWVFPQGQKEICDGSRHAGGIASASP